MVMGKGGVGKTTVAAALALGLVQRGKTVHLSTTDPAAHLAGTLDGDVPGLRVDRIDPKFETQRYVDKIMAAKSPGLDTQKRALLLEDLRPPCTEGVTVFHAFSRIVSEARSAFVVLDTAPTGQSLLLMDATGAYHRQMILEFDHGAGRVVTPLMRLQDAAYTRIILVTLPEVTPVSQVAALQGDLRRAGIALPRADPRVRAVRTDSYHRFKLLPLPPRHRARSLSRPLRRRTRCFCAHGRSGLAAPGSRLAQKTAGTRRLESARTSFASCP